MDLKALTLDQFLCVGNCTEENKRVDVFGETYPHPVKAHGKLIRELGQGYTLLAVEDEPGNVRLARDGILVGFYEGDTLAVSSELAGLHLSVPLILAAVIDRPVPASRKLLTDGKKALTRAWRVAKGCEENPWP